MSLTFGSVDEELATGRAPDPHGVARNALPRIAPEHRDEALLVALATYCEARIGETQGGPIPATTYPNAASVRS